MRNHHGCDAVFRHNPLRDVKHLFSCERVERRGMLVCLLYTSKKLKLSRRVASVWVVIAMAMAVLIGLVGRGLSGTGPVSYTHLDVYKRQD